MQFHQSLEKKYKLTGSPESDFKKPPVASSLHTFLKQQSERIEYLLEKKRDHENKLHKIETENMKKRNQLRDKIQQEQEKHAKNRKQFLDKRIKGQKFKVDEVMRKRAELLDKRKQDRKTNQQVFRKNRDNTKEFWTTKQMKLQRSYSVQVAAPPLYEEALSRKKAIESKNEQFGIRTKESLLSRHNSVIERIQSQVIAKLNRIEQHNQQCRCDYQKYEENVQKRLDSCINRNCRLKDQSEKLQKKNKDAWEKKLKGRLIDNHEKFSKTHENFAQFNSQRARSMKECRCHTKGRKDNPESGMSQSLYVEEKAGTRKSGTATNWYQIENRKKDFMMQSQTNLSSVKNNQQALREKKDLEDEKRLMKEKEIADAIKTREQIKNDSNCFVRQARLIG